MQQPEPTPSVPPVSDAATMAARTVRFASSSAAVTDDQKPRRSNDSHRHSIKERTANQRAAKTKARVESLANGRHADRQAAVDRNRLDTIDLPSKIAEPTVESDVTTDERPAISTTIRTTRSTTNANRITASKPTVASLSLALAIAETQRNDANRRELDARNRISVLETELAVERERARKYYESVDLRNGALIEGVTHHMARSHHTAMQTIQTQQEINALVVSNAIGKSIARLRNSGSRMAALLPPAVVAEVDKTTINKSTEDPTKFAAQVAAFLTETVRDANKGQDLLKSLDAAIDDGQKAADQERTALKSASASDSKQDPADVRALTASLEKQDRALGALRFERSMLAAGLERHRLAAGLQSSSSVPIGKP